jgi:hypothetical protein
MREHYAPRAVQDLPEACLVDAPELRYAGAAMIRAAFTSLGAAHTRAPGIGFGAATPLSPQLFPQILI